MGISFAIVHLIFLSNHLVLSARLMCSSMYIHFKSLKVGHRHVLEFWLYHILWKVAWNSNSILLICLNCKSSIRTIMCDKLSDMEHPRVALWSGDNEIEVVGTSSFLIESILKWRCKVLTIELTKLKTTWFVSMLAPYTCKFQVFFHPRIRGKL